MNSPVALFDVRQADTVEVRFVWALLLPLLLTMASCVTKKAPPAPPQKQAFQMYQWDREALAKAKGPVAINIYLDQQKAYFSKGGKHIGWTYVATGLPGHETPTGNFKIMEKTADKVSNLYGRLVDFEGNTIQGDFNLSKETLPEGAQFKPARMPLYMRLHSDGTGMHVGPIPRPGKRASHGCIRMPRAMAENFFANVGVGTPVTIHASGGPSSDSLAADSKSKRKTFGRSKPAA